MKDVIPYAIVLFAIGCVVAHCVGCGPTQAAKDAAETAYTAELLRCVDTASTLEESRTCRKGVNARWGVVETVAKDGGR